MNENLSRHVLDAIIFLARVRVSQKFNFGSDDLLRSLVAGSDSSGAAFVAVLCLHITRAKILCGYNMEVGDDCPHKLVAKMHRNSVLPSNFPALSLVKKKRGGGGGWEFIHLSELDFHNF